MYHVLERVPEPRIYLKEVYRILKSGGRVIIEVSHPTGIDALLSFRLLKNMLYYPNHQHLFPSKFLQRLFKEAGFIMTARGTAPSFLLAKLLKKDYKLRKKKVDENEISDDEKGGVIKTPKRSKMYYVMA